MYFAVAALPPEYPDTTFLTPLTCLNTASTPQKQPPANTAVASPGEVAFCGAPAKSGTAAPTTPARAKRTIAIDAVARMTVSGVGSASISATGYPKPYDGRIGRKFQSTVAGRPATCSAAVAGGDSAMT